ncbi:hypothetical protein GLIP_3098 [Aliiglaciecola lipolytica E3]|uniref:Uncharacterized protein n=1 Tax=Aliiglaciecola lipolytica E3 TaxID=1127673 RepID=K6X516_9ALTE|nr:hypothetical protein GLIP_3098 [Aliiglaciecola lipolytica E3]
MKNLVQNKVIKTLYLQWLEYFFSSNYLSFIIGTKSAKQSL